MATKGSSGSRRWIPRRPIDTRPIVGLYDHQPRSKLEAIAPIACYVMAAAALLLAGYAWAADLGAGHIQ